MRRCVSHIHMFVCKMVEVPSDSMLPQSQEGNDSSNGMDEY